MLQSIWRFRFRLCETMAKLAYNLRSVFADTQRQHRRIVRMGLCRCICCVCVLCLCVCPDGWEKNIPSNGSNQTFVCAVIKTAYSYQKSHVEEVYPFMTNITMIWIRIKLGHCRSGSIFIGCCKSLPKRMYTFDHLSHPSRRPMYDWFCATIG